MTRFGRFSIGSDGDHVAPPSLTASRPTCLSPHALRGSLEELKQAFTQFEPRRINHTDECPVHRVPRGCALGSPRLDIYVKSASTWSMKDASKLPGFTEEGLLPPGDYELTLEELAASLLVVGPEIREHRPNWDRPGEGNWLKTSV